MIRTAFLIALVFNSATCSLLERHRDGSESVPKQNELNDEPRNCDDDLCFEIVSNELRSENVRRINILLHRKTVFSVENLKTIFDRLDREFPSPKYLAVVAYTDSSQMEPLANGQGTGSSGTNQPTENKFHRAIYNRDKKKRMIRYTKMLGSDAMETLILR